MLAVHIKYDHVSLNDFKKRDMAELRSLYHTGFAALFLKSPIPSPKNKISNNCSRQAKNNPFEKREFTMYLIQECIFGTIKVGYF